MNKILQGDCLETLKTLPDQSVHCCVTSPPYWGLRDYGMDDQIGLEQTPEEFVAKLVEVFREVRRVLRDDGTLWLNLGDSYAGPKYNKPVGMKPKDLVGIPWMVAFALRADGWYLRSDIIWHKPNPMPESVTDRPTKAHEYLFLLSKSPTYYYDYEAIKEPVSSVQPPRRFGRREYEQAQSEKGYQGARGVAVATGQGTMNSAGNHFGRVFGGHETRNKRSVWTVPVSPYSGAHFATYPLDLIRPCILAGCPEGGIVLDPFMGAGTTAIAAVVNERQYLGCELNPDYIKIAEQRIQDECGLFLLGSLG